MGRRPAAAALLCFLCTGLVLAACAETRPPLPRTGGRADDRRPSSGREGPYATRTDSPPHGPAPGPPVRSSPLPPVEVRPPEPPVSASLRDLPGWTQDDHAAAFAALQAGCGVSRSPDMRAVCAEARAAGRLGEDAARRFLEARFRPARTAGEGVLTAYFAPAYEARSAPEGPFTAPVRPRPAGGTVSVVGYAPVSDPLQLLDGPPPPATYATPLLGADRLTIASQPAPDALAWMRPEDLFFMQVQGSGELIFPDGRRTKALYAADNGRPFTPIARPMAELGLLPRNRVGGEDIRAWLRDHAGSRADAVMNRNARYIFFSLAPADGRDPLGAAGVSLPPGRSLAVDPSRHGYGELWWIDAEAPVLAGAMPRYRRAAMTLDTGSAIRGEVRADLYIGRGAEAGREAGHVRHTLRVTRLVPVPAGER